MVNACSYQDGIPSLYPHAQTDAESKLFVSKVYMRRFPHPQTIKLILSKSKATLCNIVFCTLLFLPLPYFSSLSLPLLFGSVHLALNDYLLCLQNLP